MVINMLLKLLTAKVHANVSLFDWAIGLLGYQSRMRLTPNLPPVLHAIPLLVLGPNGIYNE